MPLKHLNNVNSGNSSCSWIGWSSSRSRRGLEYKLRRGFFLLGNRSRLELEAADPVTRLMDVWVTLKAPAWLVSLCGSSYCWHFCKTHETCYSSKYFFVPKGLAINRNFVSFLITGNFNHLSVLLGPGFKKKPHTNKNKLKTNQNKSKKTIICCFALVENLKDLLILEFFLSVLGAMFFLSTHCWVVFSPQGGNIELLLQNGSPLKIRALLNPAAVNLMTSPTIYRGSRPWSIQMFISEIEK